MWHEARRQEKKIRGLMVDLKRRADRRKEFYEKIKQDPTQFLRMYGRPVKIHLDPSVATAAEGPQSMMAWQGDNTNMIDRFDVRANLDFINEYNPGKNSSKSGKLDKEERLANYERYRTLVENEAAGLTEEHSLHQIYLDEHFGTINKSGEEEKKKNADKKAAIGYVYEDSTPVDKELTNEMSEEESDDDLDMADLDVTIDVDKLTPDLCVEVNQIAGQYGMMEDDFVRLLRKDKEELEALKEARQLEEAKAQFSGRKSRRERRAINERRQNPQRFERPSYAARDSPKYEPYKRPGSSSRSRSRSRSPEKTEVKFITSFGGNESDDEGSGVVQGPSLPASMMTVKKENKIETPKLCDTPWLQSGAETKSSRSRSPSIKPRLNSRSSTSRSQSRSRSRSSSKYRSRSRSRSRSSKRSPRRSRGRSRSRRSHSSSRSKSRSGSRSKRSRSKSDDKIQVKRYRRESLSSSSEMSGLESDEDKSTSNTKAASTSRFSVKVGGKKLNSKSNSQAVKETPQEKLKRRMQAQLNKQFRADKKAEISKLSKQERERMDREEEIRELAIEMRRRERERRHREREEEEESGRRAGKSRRRHSSSSSSSRNSSYDSRSRSPVNRKSGDDLKNRRHSETDRERRSDGDGKRERRSGDIGDDVSVRRRESGSRERRWNSRGSSRERDDEKRWGGGGREDRRGWKEGRDGYGDQRTKSRHGPSSQSSAPNRRRPLLHRPDSPPEPLMARPRYPPRH